MARLKADLAEIGEFANYLTSMQGEIESSKAQLISSIESIKGAWTGQDADAFVANATAYLENLSVVGNLLAQYGAAVGTKVWKKLETFAPWKILDKLPDAEIINIKQV